MLLHLPPYYCTTEFACMLWWCMHKHYIITVFFLFGDENGIEYFFIFALSAL